MNAHITADPRYSKAHLIDPSPYGYIHIGAEISPPSRPGPILRRSPEKRRLENHLKGLGRQLEQVDNVVKVTVYDAVGIPPLQRLPYVRERINTIELPRFDVAILVETTSPTVIPEAQASQAYDALLGALGEQAKRTRVTTARNAKRIGDVDKTRPGTFIFNHFVADDAAVMVDLFDYLAGWFEVEAGLDNSTLLTPLEESPYVAINHARSGGSPVRLAARVFPKKSFRDYVLGNLQANNVGAMPVLYRLA
ncbi:hypothetical protein [Actinopolymorpha alba]|uniref:hypothetical protein n=1 Tax=Actinopolymorpha alba TaxID=533267 RepID=UPI0007C8249F|nr:hypothetical protein [Actinopolymorpha alba]